MGLRSRLYEEERTYHEDYVSRSYVDEEEWDYHSSPLYKNFDASAEQVEFEAEQEDYWYLPEY